MNKRQIEKLQAEDPLAAKLGDTLVDPGKYKANHKKDVVVDTSQEGHHYYKWDDPRDDETTGCYGYPSVTTILAAISYNEFIVKWANNLGFRKIKYADELERSARIGTAMHAAAQLYVDPNCGAVYNPPDPLVDYYVRKRMRTLRARLEIEKPWSTYFTETAFLDKGHGFGGTIDWFVNFKGKPTIGDFKSASGMRDKFLYQIGGYMALLDANGIRAEQGMIVMPREENCNIALFPKSIMDKAVTAFFRAKEFAEEHDLIYTYVNDKQYILETPKTTQ